MIVVTYRGRDLLPDCLAGLRAQTVPHRLLVIDNASTDGSAEVLAELASGPDDRVVRLAANAGFAGGVAAALPPVGTRFCALLNDDAVADPDWLERLLAAADGDDAAAAWTSLMVRAEHPEVVNNLGAGLDRHWYGIDLDAGAAVADVRDDGRAAIGPGGRPERRDVFGFSGGAALLRMGAVRAVGGFPAEFFLYYEDLDTSWRLRLAGWQIRAVPAARVVHRHAATSDRRSDALPLPQRAQPAAHADPVRAARRGPAAARALPADHRLAGGQAPAAQAGARRPELPAEPAPARRRRGARRGPRPVRAAPAPPVAAAGRAGAARSLTLGRPGERRAELRHERESGGGGRQWTRTCSSSARDSSGSPSPSAAPRTSGCGWR